VSVIDGGGSTGSALSSALLLAARNGVYGLTMASHIKGPLLKRIVAAQITIDESTAMGTSQGDPARRTQAFWLTGLSAYVFWNLGTLAGALAGSGIDPIRYGLDGAGRSDPWRPDLPDHDPLRACRRVDFFVHRSSSWLG
jgi:predicted branched-subunit amino acid permease